MQVQPHLPSEVEASLGYMKLFLKTKTTNIREKTVKALALFIRHKEQTTESQALSV